MRWKVSACFFVAAFACTGPLPAADFVEQPVTVPVAGGTLAGTLTLPSGSGPFPVALIVAGSGPVDRDGNEGSALQSDVYKKLAAGLAGAGIATLRYDKRGVGASVTGQSESALRFDDYVNDALALAAWLEKDPRFSSVAVIGHSEGSLIGILAAQRDPHIRALVSLEGAGRDLGAIIDEQIRNSPGTPPSLVDEVVRINASLRAGKTVPDPDPRLASLFRPSVQPYLISEYRYDPAKEIAKLTIPVLIVHGTSDIQVSAADAHLLAEGDPRAKTLTIDGMNHLLVDAPVDRSANLATYMQPSLPLAPALVPALVAFLR